MSSARMMGIMGIAAAVAIASQASGNISSGTSKAPLARTTRDGWPASEFNWSSDMMKAAGVSTAPAGMSVQKPVSGAKLVVRNPDGKPSQPKPENEGRSAERGLRRIPLSHEQLIAFRGSIDDLAGDGRPTTAPPGVFVNFIPNPGDVGDGGGNGTSVPAPPALVLAAVGLGLVTGARRFAGALFR